jgi:hypothetical protein
VSILLSPSPLSKLSTVFPEKEIVCFGPKYKKNSMTKKVEMNRENNMSPDTKLQTTTNRIHKHINRPMTGMGINKSITIKKPITKPCKEIYVSLI